MPEIILVSSTFSAMAEATLKFGGRNWRRLKREQNKAWRKARAGSHKAGKAH